MTDHDLERAIRRQLRRLRLTLTADDPAVGAAIDTAKGELASTLVAPLSSAPMTTPDHTGTAAPPVADLPPVPRADTAHSEIAQAALAALAALALGDSESAPRIGRWLRGQPIAQSEAAHLYPLIFARHLAWTGSIHTVRDEWPHILEALAERPSEADGPTAAEWRRVLHELALTAESIGQQEVARRLRAESAAPANSARPLAAVAPTTASLGAGPGERSGPGSESRSGPESGSGSGAGLDSGSTHGRSAVDIVDYYLHQVLGIEPDAPQNRLVLRPRLPKGWSELRVERLCFGDAELTIDYRREDERHRFAFVQESGAVPIQVIFEPSIPAGELASARVDGEAAQLDPRPDRGHFGRIVVPVQIVLDDLRVVELEGAPASGVKKRTRISLPVR